VFDRSRRNRLDALAIAGALLAWLVLGDDAGRGADGVLYADFGISAAVGAIVSILSGLFGLFRGKQDTGSKLAFEGLRGSITEMGRSFLSSIVDVAGKLAAIIGTFIRFVQKTFARLYEQLAKLVTRIARILDRIFGPIIDFLDKIRGHLKKFYDKVLRPIIDTIEMVRSFLRLLSLFGIEWSKKLDAQLGQLEQYILAPFEFLVQKLNQALDLINRIITVDGLLQRFTLLGSMLRDAGLITNLAFNTALRDRGTGLIPISPGSLEGVDPNVMHDDLEEHFATGNSRYSPAIRESAANVRILIRRAG
jgi:hypothetical protein